jgi:Uncharacterized Fe-S protein
VCDALRRKYSVESFVPAGDMSPLSERESAWLACIGLLVTSGLLILPPYGAYVFLATFLAVASLAVPVRPAVPDCPGLRGLPVGFSRRAPWSMVGRMYSACLSGSDPRKRWLLRRLPPLA